ASCPAMRPHHSSLSPRNEVHRDLVAPHLVGDHSQDLARSQHPALVGFNRPKLAHDVLVPLLGPCAAQSPVAAAMNRLVLGSFHPDAELIDIHRPLESTLLEPRTVLLR